MYKVYLYTFPNGKKYCGLTCQTLQERARSGEGYKHCPAVYHAIQKYGWHNVTKEILADGLTHNEACLLEQQTIAELNLTDSQFGYNLTSGGDSGSRHSEETKKKMSAITKENWMKEDSPYRTEESKANRRKYIYNDEVNARRKESMKKTFATRESKLKRSAIHGGQPIYQIDLRTGEIIAGFEMLIDAEAATSAPPRQIGMVCRGERDTCGGFGWMYQSDPRTWHEFQKERHEQLGKDYYPVAQIDKKTNEIIATYPSATQAALAVKNNSQLAYLIYRCCRGETHQAIGYKWKKIEEKEEN